MAPTAAIQARIAAFEGHGSSKDLPENAVPFAESVADSTGSSSSNLSLSPTTSSSFPSEESSPPKSSSIEQSPLAMSMASSSTRTSVIDLKDWVIDDGPNVLPSALRENGNGNGVRSPRAKPTMAGRKEPPTYDLDSSTPLINFDSSSPPKSRSTTTTKVPPLPPRKPSLTSIRSISSPITIHGNGHGFGASLKPPDADYSYSSNLSDLDIASGRRGGGHAPASSISSYHSLSLSSDGGTDPGSLTNYVQNFPGEKGVKELEEGDRDRDWTEREAEDGDSLNDSFEDVSAPSSFVPTNTFIPPSRNPLAKPPPPPPMSSKSQSQSKTSSSGMEPPKLPQRPKPRISAPPAISQSASTSIIPSLTSIASNSLNRRGTGITSSPTSPAGSRITSPVLTPVLTASAHSTGSGSTSSNSSNLANALRRVPPPPPPPTFSHTPPPPSHISRSRPSHHQQPPIPTRAGSTSASASASDRSSIRSYASTSSRTSSNTHTNSTMLPPPPPKRNLTDLAASYGYNPRVGPSSFSSKGGRTMPLEARVRYDAVFDANVRAREKAKRSGSLLSPLSAFEPGSGMKRGMRQNAGWRGLSVDLITDPDAAGEKEKGEKYGGWKGEQEPPVDRDARLEGSVVKMIWTKSRLEKSVLRNIWMECDPTAKGSLDREAFALGMWRIDTELEKALKARRAAVLGNRARYGAGAGGGRRPPQRKDSAGSVSLIQM